MERETEYIRQVMIENQRNLAPMLKYLSWLESSADRMVSTLYQGEGIAQSSITFPIYDSTLLNFVREAGASPFMERNYQYIYTRNRIKNHDDERRMIEQATWKEWDILRGIFSRYVLGGRTKATLWTEAVQERIFYLVLRKMKEIIEYWDKPMDVR